MKGHLKSLAITGTGRRLEPGPVLPMENSKNFQPTERPMSPVESDLASIKQLVEGLHNRLAELRHKLGPVLRLPSPKDEKPCDPVCTGVLLCNELREQARLIHQANEGLIDLLDRLAV